MALPFGSVLMASKVLSKVDTVALRNGIVVSAKNVVLPRLFVGILRGGDI